MPYNWNAICRFQLIIGLVQKALLTIEPRFELSASVDKSGVSWPFGLKECPIRVTIEFHTIDDIRLSRLASNLTLVGSCACWHGFIHTRPSADPTTGSCPGGSQIPHRPGLLSGEHFSVDGTLIQAWASHKSFKPKDDDGSAGDGSHFKGQKRCNDTHQSTTDGDARLYRKGNTAAELSYIGHSPADNRHSLITNACVTQADGYAERAAAKAMIGDAVQAAPENSQVTLGADKAYDAQEFVEHLQTIKVQPHITQNTSGRRSAVPDEVASTEGYRQPRKEKAH